MTTDTLAHPDQHVLVQEPPTGLVVRMPVGRQLVLRFRTRLGPSRWRVAERPDHLVPLPGDGTDLAFLVFDGDEPGRLRLERADPGGRVHETRLVLVETRA